MLKNLAATAVVLAALTSCDDASTSIPQDMLVSFQHAEEDRQAQWTVMANKYQSYSAQAGADFFTTPLSQVLTQVMEECMGESDQGLDEADVIYLCDLLVLIQLASLDDFVRDVLHKPVLGVSSVQMIDGSAKCFREEKVDDTISCLGGVSTDLAESGR